VNPFTLVNVSVVEVLPPWMMLNEDGDSDMVKFFVPVEAFTVKVIVVL
jgi:hypothetical protein